MFSLHSNPDIEPGHHPLVLPVACEESFSCQDPDDRIRSSKKSRSVSQISTGCSVKCEASNRARNLHAQMSPIPQPPDIIATTVRPSPTNGPLRTWVLYWPDSRIPEGGSSIPSSENGRCRISYPGYYSCQQLLNVSPIFPCHKVSTRGPEHHSIFICGTSG
ncbi:hypothetical protein BKA82DRAFT_845554 [Pisolithus tinctorius]|uniref:Uncharacterized protein n=1 Tax=Pisolithus tinctorius Marx 270 TaxID=870435 RepID=A0A0C3NBX5_PISTI|nr:hypothetical protein BKA82DRAFT_845554 [Pisolithus tinctorius]KIN98639.1 hypothetical protein M404DRAFT_845554 [Pisolithus tinctorius Marx 270]